MTPKTNGFCNVKIKGWVNAYCKNGEKNKNKAEVVILTTDKVEFEPSNH